MISPTLDRTMQDGWRDDLRWVKDDLKRTQRELDTKTSTSELSGCGSSLRYSHSTLTVVTSSQ